MKKPTYTSVFRSFSISKFAKLCFLSLGLGMMLGVWYSCKKDTPALPYTQFAQPHLTIDEAKHFFQTKLNESGLENTVQSRDSSETETPLPMTPNWNQAVSYYDVEKKQSVVEVPLTGGLFSRYVINPNGTGIGTADPQMLPIKKLIIVEDSLHSIDYAIMKINGTIPYLTTSAQIVANSYHQMDSLFEGVVSYVDIQDQIKKQYYRKDHTWYLIDSTSVLFSNPNEAQDRWEIICIHQYYETPCSSGEHMGDEPGCLVGGGGTYEYELCFDVYPVYWYGGGSGYALNVPAITIGGGIGGGGGGNNNNTGGCNCQKTLFDEYFMNFVPDFPIPYSGYTFNFNHVVVGANCNTGNFVSGKYKAYLVPGQSSNGREIESYWDMDYCELDATYPGGPCKRYTSLLYSGTIHFKVVYFIGGIGLELHRQYLSETNPEFLFQ